ncbi:MAG: TraR/DksA C4-type zinc finger protein [Burkholderiaceae bacterium]|nr:TraR/DksA C4-type zinc finger protein [Burkholderiaceae bacterium]
MSDLSDPNDRASVREAQIREDALAEVRRLQAEQAAKGATTKCDTCGYNIPVARRRALPYVRLCVDCARDAETRAKAGKRA